MHSSYILSVYFGFHDSCLTISDGKEILLHMEAERYFRKKHLKLNGEQMEKMVEAALDYLSISINDVRELLVASWNNQWSDPVVLSGKKFDPIITAHHSNHLGTMIPAGFDDAIIICADGGSENGTTKIYFKEGNTFTMLEDLDHSIMTGKFYGTITQMIVDPYFIRAHDTYPGKTMGLAALGSRSEEMIALLTNNALTLDTLHVKGCQSLNKKFGISLDYERIWLDQRRCDLAYNAQSYWQSTFMNKIAEYSQKSENIAFVGGCALNVLLNSEVEKSGLFKRIYISPVSGDGGQSLGAILYRYPGTVCRYPFLGRGFGETLVTDSLVGEVVDDLMEHKIIAWYQDRSEAGARSLGHRSFLGLADSMSMKKKLSEEIKGREPYRPVAAIVPEKSVSTYFEFMSLSPFMTFAPQIREEYLNKVPAVVHFDGTTRIQTICQSDNPLLHDVLTELERRGVIPVLMNSSLNIAGEPIVDTPDEALSTFGRSGADVLYINGKRYGKE